MTGDAPLVSVILPVFNGAGHVASAVRSVAAQTVEGHELIVVDDGSTDGSAAVAEASGHPNVRVVRQENLGVSAARNYGVALARGRWVGFIDADDLYHRQRLESLLAAAKVHGASAVASTALKFCSPANSPQLKAAGEWADLIVPPEREAEELVRRGLPDTSSSVEWLDHRALLRGNRILSMSILIERTHLLRAGLFPVNLTRAEDFNAWINVARIAPIAFVESPGYFHRVRPGSASRSEDMMLPELLVLLGQWFGGRDLPAGAGPLREAGHGYLKWQFDRALCSASESGDRWRAGAVSRLAHFLLPDPADRRRFRRRAFKTRLKHLLPFRGAR